MRGCAKQSHWYKANSEWLEGVRGGEYRSYYEKYYENRDISLRAIRARTGQSAAKLSAYGRAILKSP